MANAHLSASEVLKAIRCRGSVTLILVLAAFSAAGAEPRRVLLLHSFGREFEPFNTFSEHFRSELAQQSAEPLDFFDVGLQSARFEQLSQEGPFVDYLVALFAGRRLDLVVPIGGPAARFTQKHRSRLFPGTPMLLAAVDRRLLQDGALTPNDAVVAARIDAALVMDNILRVLPSTTNVAVVFGNSPIEKFWAKELRREFQRFTNRVGFAWLDALPFDQIKARAARLPARSVL